MKRLLFLVLLLPISGCASLHCVETDSPEACAQKKREAWVQFAKNYASTDPANECRNRAAALSREEVVVGQECEKIPASETANERLLCKSVTESRTDPQKYNAVLAQCQNEKRRDQRERERNDSKSLIKPIDCELYPNSPPCYGRRGAN